jgi:hypothetical protein
MLLFQGQSYRRSFHDACQCSRRNETTKLPQRMNLENKRSRPCLALSCFFGIRNQIHRSGFCLRSSQNTHSLACLLLYNYTMKTFKYVYIEPSEFTFKTTPENNRHSRVTLSNASEHPVGFKLKTNAPQRYTVKPVIGIVLEGGTRDILGKSIFL